LVEEIGIPAETHRPVASHWQTLSNNVITRQNKTELLNILAETSWQTSDQSKHVQFYNPHTAKTQTLLFICLTWKCIGAQISVFGVRARSYNLRTFSYTFF
jgi:hypothetical protein